jgi:hypothetical protein
MRPARLFLFLCMTPSVARCTSILQTSHPQLLPGFPLPRYLEKWVVPNWEILVSD